MDFGKILLAETAGEILELTQTKNILDAERMVIDAYSKSAQRTGSRILTVLFGVFLLCISLVFFPLSLLLFPVGIWFLYFSLFGKRAVLKRLRKKFTDLHRRAKEINAYPELVTERNISALIPQSAVVSRAAKISGVGQMITNTDTTKHLWTHAGFCRIDNGRGTSEWQHYYVFVYRFNGTVPQTLMVHANDRFLLPVSTDNIALTNVCPPWRVITAEQYEIESLSILTKDVVANLISLADDNPPCTIEFFESKLLLFIPVEEVSLIQLFTFEKTSDIFARTLLPTLNESRLTMIGNIPPTLAFEIETNEEGTPMTESEKRQHKLALFTLAISVFLFFILVKAAQDEVFSPNYIILYPPALFFVIFFMLPQRFRIKMMEGSGLRVNNRKVNVRRKIK